MNMIKDIIGSMAYSNLFGVLGTLIMFIMFGIIVIWALKLDKKYIDDMGHLPLEHVNGAGNEDDHA